MQSRCTVLKSLCASSVIFFITFIFSLAFRSCFPWVCFVLPFLITYSALLFLSFAVCCFLILWVPSLIHCHTWAELHYSVHCTHLDRVWLNSFAMQFVWCMCKQFGWWWASLTIACACGLTSTSVPLFIFLGHTLFLLCCVAECVLDVETLNLICFFLLSVNRLLQDRAVALIFLHLFVILFLLYT